MTRMMGYDYGPFEGLPCCGHRAVQHDGSSATPCRCCRRGTLPEDGQPPPPEETGALRRLLLRWRR